MWSGLNTAVLLQAPEEVMQFGQILPRHLCIILHTNTCGGVGIFMSNIDNLDAYMRVLIRPEELPQLAFLVPPHPSDHNTLIGFHLSLPMGCVESELYFFCARKTVAHPSSQIWAAVTTSALHLLLAIVDTTLSPMMNPTPESSLSIWMCKSLHTS